MPSLFALSLRLPENLHIRLLLSGPKVKVESPARRGRTESKVRQ